MSLVFESEAFRQNPGEAATHVLLVGCGEYPNLAAAGFGGLDSLTSPRLSVHAMADWFLSGEDAMPVGQGQPSDKAFHNPQAPLGTLTMLTSPSDGYTTPAGHTVQATRPTLENIRNAYVQWLDRLTHQESRGVFHFCGHGISDGITQFLVADDFGDGHDPWANAFHVSNTCQATIRRTQASLFFFLDSCMELSNDLINRIDTPQALIGGARSGQVMTTEWAILRATTANRKAYAENNTVARFTAAMLQALRGHAGSLYPAIDGFGVCVSDLRDATGAFLVYSQRAITGEKQKLGRTEGEGTWDVPLHVQTERPSVLVELDIQPEGYRPVAHAFIEDAARARETKPLSAGPANFVKAQGEWSYGTRSENGVYDEQFLDRQLLTKAVHSRCFRIP